MAQVYYDRDVDLAPLAGKTVAVIGYGSQGSAQAQNLRDAGIRVVVGARPGGEGWRRAEADGFAVEPVERAAARADVIQLLVPDEVQPEVYERQIRPHLAPGKALGFSHGFNVHFGQIVPPPDVDVFLVAPKAPGARFRALVAAGQGVPGLVAVHQDATGEAWPRALAYAKAVGCTRAGVIRTTFAEETETDLFGEQAILCGGVTALVQAAFETLVEAGYQPEVAYFECLHELKLIVDLMYEGGIGRMRQDVSRTACYGDLTRGPRIIGPAVRAAMREVLEEVRSGRFAREWVLEYRAGLPVFRALLRRQAEHPIEEVGRRLRAMMPWLTAQAAPDAGPAAVREAAGRPAAAGAAAGAAAAGGAGR